jgi:hypothetical protein
MAGYQALSCRVAHRPRSRYPAQVELALSSGAFRYVAEKSGRSAYQAEARSRGGQWSADGEAQREISSRRLHYRGDRRTNRLVGQRSGCGHLRARLVERLAFEPLLVRPVEQAAGLLEASDDGGDGRQPVAAVVFVP